MLSFISENWQFIVTILTLIFGFRAMGEQLGNIENRIVEIEDAVNPERRLDL